MNETGLLNLTVQVTDEYPRVYTCSVTTGTTTINATITIEILGWHYTHCMYMTLLCPFSKLFLIHNYLPTAEVITWVIVLTLHVLLHRLVLQ